jgi:hypothetical protein
MAKNYHVYQQKEALLHQQVGLAVSRWAVLEMQLLMCFAAATRMSDQEVAAFFINVKAFSLALDLVNAAVRNRVAKGVGITRWNSLAEYVRELSGDRNFVAHTQVTAHAAGHPDDADWAIAIPKVGPAMAPYLTGTEKMPPMELSEVAEICGDIQEAIELTAEFVQALRSEPPAWPSKFSEPIVRRRPPRKVRLAGGQKAPPRPPRS